ncbi:MAG: efflux RND transporter permease subunit [Nitriliruptoraceae bacterium]
MRTLIRLLAGVTARFPWTVLAVTLALTVVLAGLASTLESASGQEGFSPESEEIAASERIGELFGDGSTSSVLQVLVADEGGDVLTLEALEVVADLEEAITASEAGEVLASGPGQPPVLSYLTPVQEALATQGLTAADLPDDDAVKQLYADALASAGPELGFASQLVPEDAGDAPELGMVLVFVETASDVDTQIEREVAVADAVAEVDGTTDLEVSAFSFALLFGDGDDFVGEVSQLFATAFLIIVVVLLFVFWVTPIGMTTRLASARRMVADTSVVMLTIVLVVLWMNGVGALLQRAGLLGPLTEVTQIVPILLVGLGVDYGIHLTSRYRDEIGAGRTVERSMRTSIGTVGVALVLATVTTAIGFLTNIINPIPALRDFGILASVGIVLSFVLMLTFVPAVRIVLDRRAEKATRLPTEGLGATRDRLLPELAGRTATLAERAPIPTLVVALVLGGLGYVGLSNISTEFSFTDFLPEDSPVVQTLGTIEDAFGGGFGETTQVLVEDAELTDPAVFNAFGEAASELADTPDVLTVATPQGSVASVTSPASVVQQLLLPGPDGSPLAPGFAEAAVAAGYDPATGTMAADGDVQALLDAAREAAPEQLGATLAFDGGTPIAALLEIDTQAGDDRAIELRDAVVEDTTGLAEQGATVTVTSNAIITAGIVTSLSDSQIASLLITLLAATLVLMVTFWVENRRPFLGVLTMVPVALVVLWTFGLMYVSDIPFGPVTATLTGLAVGIGVPYTIHMARRFEEDRNRYDSIEEAIRETTRNTGGALAGSAFTTAGGFGILITSTLVPFQQMGQVTAYAIVLSLVGALLVLPSLLVLWEGWHRRRGEPVVEKETVSVA